MKDIIHVGIDVGSTTVKTVVMDEKLEVLYSTYKRHFSDTKNTVCECLEELTKKFEEFIHGSITEVLEVCDTFKGEMVVIVDGYEDKEVEENINPIEKINELISIGYKSKEAIKEVANEYKLDKKELYDLYVRSKNNN